MLLVDASSTRGLWGAGQTPARQDVIDYVTIASEGNAIDFGNLTEEDSEPCSTSSSTRGILVDIKILWIF